MICVGRNQREVVPLPSLCFVARGKSERCSCRVARRIQLTIIFIPLLAFLALATEAHGKVTAVSLQSPGLATGSVTNVVSPIHLQATAEANALITGYVVYVDGANVFQNWSPSVDAWIVVPKGPHTMSVTAWDSDGSLSTYSYNIAVTGFAPPTPPANAKRLVNIDNGTWTVDNHPDVGGDCNHGSLGAFQSGSDPNTRNIPASDGMGQHFVLRSECTYDDTLFYRKFSQQPSPFASTTNFLWDFWFYIPNSTSVNTIQALEHDMFQAIPLWDGVHEFMFGSQCNYITNQWQFWLPNGTSLAWRDSGISPCRFEPGSWHHATYYLQRVNPSGYQKIPKSLGPNTDKNSSLRYGTLTIDGRTFYLGGVAWSTIPYPAWSSVIGVQHQLDSAVAGALIEEYLDRESLTAW